MVRVLVFGLILALSIGLAHWTSTKIPYAVDVSSFFFGLGVAALTGFAWMQINGWWSTVTKPFKPMKVTLETKETPAQVNFASLFAIARGVIVIGVIVTAIIYILANS